MRTRGRGLEAKILYLPSDEVQGWPSDEHCALDSRVKMPQTLSNSSLNCGFDVSYVESTVAETDPWISFLRINKQVARVRKTGKPSLITLSDC